jgi:chemotaxis protein MotB
MRKKKGGHQEHENSERWLLTYADLITLLLGLFVILYAMSKIDAGKYQELVAAMGGVFGSGSAGVVQGTQGVINLPIPAAASERQKIEKDVRSALGLDKRPLPVSITHNERGITVHMMEELLFASGSAELKAASLATLDTLATVLRVLPNDIRVEGHTDDVPISNAEFPSNWHLSVARAVRTAYYLISRNGLPPTQVSVAGYSEYRPLAPNTTPANRSLNRRVDIVIVTSLAGSGEGADSTDHKPTVQ